MPLLGWLRTHLDVGPVRVLHDWSFALYVYVIYRMVLLAAGPGHSGRVFDEWLIAADRWLFGVDPTVWLARLAHPIVTEILQLAYAMSSLLPLAVAIELYAGGREWRFRQWAFVCGCGCFLAYAGYLILPAIGPRFTLHELEATARELPGLWLTPALRARIDAACLVPVGVAADEALRLAPRDAFPAASALVTMLSMAWAWRYRLRVRWVVTIVGALGRRGRRLPAVSLRGGCAGGGGAGDPVPGRGAGRSRLARRASRDARRGPDGLRPAARQGAVSASIRATSSGVSRSEAAASNPSTCFAFLNPTIAPVTAGWRSVQAMATAPGDVP